MFQFNYYINTMCNQKCSYCYARADMKWNTILNYGLIKLDIETFKQYKHKSIISLIGGEPTLHPQIKTIMKNLTKTHHELHIYTNGTYTKKFDDAISKLFTWTFSYHGTETDTKLFIKNMKHLLPIAKVELTIIAQNMDDEMYEFINDYNINTVITFIHDSSKILPFQNIDEKVLTMQGDNIRNMSKFYKTEHSYKGQLCDYKEIDILNGFMTSNECNMNIHKPFTIKNINGIEPYNNICDKDFCPNDCAFLLPKKVII